MKDSERMIVSAWTDGEVELPWSSLVSAKVEQNPEWSETARQHNRVKQLLVNDGEPDWTAAQSRVWDHLAAQNPVRPFVAHLPWSWISVAAAALLVVAAGGGYWFGRVSVVKTGPQMAELKVHVPQQLELKLSGDGQLIMASTLQGAGP